jgi:N-acetylglutamate synthase-like GNAT family acetyltransferase
MTLTDTHAEQIAALLNERNQLKRKHTRESVLEHAGNYICRFSKENNVVACVEVKSVQWYQSEVLHLTVAASQTRKGHAKALLCEAERVARSKGARLLQCTIRDGNTESRSLFEGFGFLHINTFNNPSSGNNVAVFQKVLSSAR